MDGRRLADSGGRAIQMEGAAEGPDLPCARVVELDDRPALEHLRVGDQILDSADRPCGNTRLLEQVEPLVSGSLHETLLEKSKELCTVQHPRRVGRKTFLAGDLRDAERLAKPPPALLCRDTDHEPV